MDKKDILSRVDHTLLKQTATWEQIEKLCREGLEYAAASVAQDTGGPGRADGELCF